MIDLRKYGVEIRVENTLGGSIAKVNIDTGIITIAKDRFSKFNEDIQTFVLLHETGHFVLQSANEKRVDRWALEQYMKLGKSPKSAVLALSEVLDFRNKEHIERLRLQFDNARHFDFHLNGNKSALLPQLNNYKYVRNYSKR